MWEEKGESGALRLFHKSRFTGEFTVFQLGFYVKSHGKNPLGKFKNMFPRVVPREKFPYFVSLVRPKKKV